MTAYALCFVLTVIALAVVVWAVWPLTGTISRSKDDEDKED